MANEYQIAQCRHCFELKPMRRRGLCWKCYAIPGVLERYPSTSKHAQRGLGIPNLSSKPTPAEPTFTAPGTPERVLVYQQRMLRGESLWHPEDATY